MVGCVCWGWPKPPKPVAGAAAGCPNPAQPIRIEIWDKCTGWFILYYPAQPIRIDNRDKCTGCCTLYCVQFNYFLRYKIKHYVIKGIKETDMHAILILIGFKCLLYPKLRILRGTLISVQSTSGEDPDPVFFESRIWWKKSSMLLFFSWVGCGRIRVLLQGHFLNRCYAKVESTS